MRNKNMKPLMNVQKNGQIEADFEGVYNLTSAAYWQSIGRTTNLPTPENPYHWVTDTISTILEKKALNKNFAEAIYSTAVKL